MQNIFASLKKMANTTEGQHFVSTLLGGATVGTICFLYDRKRYNNPRALILGKDAYEALINGDTDFVRFTSDLHPHVFRVTLEQ